MTGEHTRRAIEDTEIPWPTWLAKLRKTAIGLGAVAMAIVVTIWWIPPLSHWVVYPLLLYGAFSVAGDVTRSFGKWFPAFLKDVAVGIRDVIAAVKGK